MRATYLNLKPDSDLTVHGSWTRTKIETMSAKPEAPFPSVTARKPREAVCARAFGT